MMYLGLQNMDIIYKTQKDILRGHIKHVKSAPVISDNLYALRVGIKL
jgi:hypothetical protein